MKVLDSYRFGFNGKEKIDEAYGEGNCYDYGFRIHDPRIGRFLSMDPLSNNYPWFTPYQFAGNNPILNIDLDGLENLKATKKYVVLIFEGGKQLPDGTVRIFNNVTYTAGTTITEQGDEGAHTEVTEVSVKDPNAWFGSASERYYMEAPTPVIAKTDETHTAETTTEVQNTANSKPVDVQSDDGGSLFGKELPGPNDKPFWVKGNATFESDRWSITNAEQVKASLDPIADALNSNDKLQITIFGNVGPSGAGEDWDGPTNIPGLDNRTLALNRANAIKDLLIREYGVKADQINVSTSREPGKGLTANYCITNTGDD